MTAPPPTPPAPAPVAIKPPLAETLTGEQIEAVKERIVEALHKVFDPEIPVNIYELGLIYDVKVDPSGAVGIQMTLTSPSCPAAQSLPAEVQAKTRGVRGVTDVTVDVVWDPPWESSKMSEAAKLQLGFM